MPSASKKVKKNKHKIKKSKPCIPNEKIKKKPQKDLMTVVYLDERNSGHLGPDLTEEYCNKAKEKGNNYNVLYKHLHLLMSPCCTFTATIPVFSGSQH